MKIKYFILAASLILLFSCQNDDISQNEMIDQNNTENNAHFIDDVVVSEDVFTTESTNKFLVEIYKASDNLKSTSDNSKVEHRAYSSEKKYIEFGNKNGYDFKKHLSFEKIMSKYAKETGAINKYEQKGEVPAWYLTRDKFVYDSIFENTSDEKSALGMFTALYEDHYVPGSGAGSCVMMATTLPFMYPGWNNRVSCVEFVSFGGALVIYDRTFYRRRLKTMINWGMSRINLVGGVDNAMSSTIPLF